jgi:hypothetical protein
MGHVSDLAGETTGPPGPLLMSSILDIDTICLDHVALQRKCLLDAGP